MRTLVIGDVHGCLEELNELLLVARFKNVDSVVFCGDLIDRGPDPVGVVRRVQQIGARCVLGNHEEKMIRWFKHEKTRGAKKNPMQVRPERAAEWQALSESDRFWCSMMPAWIDLGSGWYVVHAGFEPGRPIIEQESKKTCRIQYVDDKGLYASTGDPRETPAGAVAWYDVWKHPESVIYGHRVPKNFAIEVTCFTDYGRTGLYIPPSSLPRFPKMECGETWGIETGVVFGGVLTGVVLEDGEIVDMLQVPAKQTYFADARRGRDE